MVCPNCKADDNVSIQGQNYCLNCGQLIPEVITATVAAATTNTPETVSVPAPAPKPVEVAQPEPAPAIVEALAEPAVEPKPAAAVTVAVATTAVKAAAETSVKAAATATKVAVNKPTIVSPTVGRRRVDLQPTAPRVLGIKKPKAANEPEIKVVASAGTVKRPEVVKRRPNQIRQVSDIKPRSGSAPVRPSVLPVPTLDHPVAHSESTPAVPATVAVTTKAETTTPKPIKTAAPVTVNQKDDPLTTAFMRSLKGKGRRFGYLSGIITFLPLAIWFGHLARLADAKQPAWSAAYGRVLLRLIRPTAHLAFTNLLFIVAGVSLAYAFVAIVIKLWSMAALTYGYSKELDHRSVPRHNWATAGWNSLVSCFGLTAWWLILVTALGFIGWVADDQIRILLGSTGTLSLVARLATIAIVALVVAGITGRTLLAGSAIIVGGQKFRVAWKTGGELGGHSLFRTAGWLVINLVFVALAVSLATAASFLTLWLLYGFGNPQVAAYAVGLVSLLAFSAAFHWALVFTVVFWLYHYRRLTAKYLPSQLAILLSGRSVGKRKYGPGLALLVVGLVIVAALSGGGWYNRAQINQWYTANVSSPTTP